MYMSITPKGFRAALEAEFKNGKEKGFAEGRKEGWEAGFIKGFNEGKRKLENTTIHEDHYAITDNSITKQRG